MVFGPAARRMPQLPIGVDEEGYLYFADRAKDYLRHRGENVSSFEVEAAFMQMRL